MQSGWDDKVLHFVPNTAPHTTVTFVDSFMERFDCSLSGINGDGGESFIEGHSAQKQTDVAIVIPKLLECLTVTLKPSTCVRGGACKASSINGAIECFLVLGKIKPRIVAVCDDDASGNPGGTWTEEPEADYGMYMYILV